MRRAQGSISRHGDGWRVFATIHDGMGGTRRVSRVVRGNRRAAERALAELLKDDYRTERPRTFSEVCDEYLADCDRRVKRGELRAHTVSDYRKYVELHIRPALGRCTDPSPHQVRRLLDRLDRGRHPVHATLRQICNFGERRGLMASNPMRRVEAPPAPRLAGREDVYTADEVAAILGGLDSEPEWFRRAVAIAIGCGLRRGEICGLDGSDFDGSRLSVTKAYGKDAPKTENGIRTVSVPPSIMPLLGSVSPSKPLIEIDGVRVRPDTVTHRWRRFTASRGLRYLPFKNLRHTSLTMAYEATGDIYAVSRRAGHAGIAITTRYYARPDQRIDDAVADAMSRSMLSHSRDTLGGCAESSHTFAHGDPVTEAGQKPENGL